MENSGAVTLKGLAIFTGVVCILLAGTIYLTRTTQLLINADRVISQRLAAEESLRMRRQSDFIETRGCVVAQVERGAAAKYLCSKPEPHYLSARDLDVEARATAQSKP